MNIKKIIIIVISSLVSFTLIVLIFFGILRYKPQYLGLPPHPEDTTKAVFEVIEYTEPNMQITKEEFDKLQQETLNRTFYKTLSENLKNDKKYLYDSLKKIDQVITNCKDSIKKITVDNNKTNKTISDANDSLIKLHSELKKSIDEIAVLKQKIQDQDKYLDKKIDSLETVNFQTFAKIYNNSNPVEVARILEQIDERDAAKILKIMSKKKAGKVLEAMNPQNAATILLLGAGE